jgi:hypothetical protein
VPAGAGFERVVEHLGSHFELVGPEEAGGGQQIEHIGEPTRPPTVLPARPPPQGEFQFDQTLGPDDWPEMDQTAGLGNGWD